MNKRPFQKAWQPISSASLFKIIEDKKGIKSGVYLGFASVKYREQKRLEREALNESRKKKKVDEELKKTEIDKYRIELLAKRDYLIESGVPDNIAIIYDSDVIISTNNAVIVNGEIIKEFGCLKDAKSWFENIHAGGTHDFIKNFGKIKIYTKQEGFLEIKL